MKAVVVIRGGVLDAVYSDRSDLDDTLIDHDDMEVWPNRRQKAEAVERCATEGLTRVY